ncbi:DUF3303 family protein [Methyloceanibacter sp.]|uniref:DUF3303 family protein n=1 Tax=Methyloceanibacter sp. TaxID=1965321 RepID=UPI0020863765|nr:DUF3303 family protein [Methyloceanibacter sp.]GFO81426.1 MAG: hypothetical protein A49_10530 [Methyloceanibacter sp.]HML93758.1 hypothetical protein [Methyloceanibacter sp.]
MRLMLRFSIPVERGNQARDDGTLGPAMDAIVEQTKAEAAYFLVENGKRTGYIFFEADDQALLPKLNEPMFAALDAAIDIIPALTLDDLKRGLAN